MSSMLQARAEDSKAAHTAGVNCAAQGINPHLSAEALGGSPRTSDCPLAPALERMARALAVG
jgi:hypothetical protein